MRDAFRRETQLRVASTALSMARSNMCNSGAANRVWCRQSCGALQLNSLVSAAQVVCQRPNRESQRRSHRATGTLSDVKLDERVRLA